jgi:hypothetical protein
VKLLKSYLMNYAFHISIKEEVVNGALNMAYDSDLEVC